MNNFLNSLQETVDEFRSIPKILLGDINAKAASWFSKSTDDRVVLLEDFIIANDLYMVNREGEPYTF